MKKLLLLIICFVWFNSCRTTKQTATADTEINTATEITRSKKEEVKTASVTVSDISENVTETDSAVVEQIILEYSKPDSAGKQWVEKIITTTTTAGKTRKAEKVETTNLNQVAEIQLAENQITTQQQVINSETLVKTTKKFPLWKVIPLIALVAGAAFLLWKFNTVWNR